MCATQHPVFSTFRSLREAGWARAAIDRAVESGMLTRVRRGVYAGAGACADAISAVAHGGILACTSAGRHEGLWVLTEPAHPHVALRGRDHHYPGHEECECTVHWDKVAATDAFGWASIVRILRQILQCAGAEEFFVAVESAMRQRKVGAADIDWLRQHTNAVGREALDHARWDADSGLESLVRWRLRSHHLSVRTQVSIAEVGVVDLVIGERLLVEVDGRENHDGAENRHKDLTRDANAAVWGLVTLRFDYALVVHDWDLVEHAILGQIAAGRHL